MERTGRAVELEAELARLRAENSRLLRLLGMTPVEVHDYHDADTGVLAASLAKRAPGYVSLGFPDPRRLQHLPPAAI